MSDQYVNPEEFIHDESFVSWALGSRDRDAMVWDAWIKDHPDQKQLVEEIAAVLRLTRLEEIPVDGQQIADAETRLREAIQAISPSAKVIPFRKRRIWYAVAALFIIGMAAGLAYFLQAPPPKQIASNYGQVIKNKLPDGTEVILNAHSRLTLGKTWKEGNPREVWIRGEAFFHVRKTPEHDRFIVHTDAFDIEVTGTSFNVKNMNGKSSVVLKEGSVNIHRNGQSDIRMKPGDYVVFDNNQIQKKKVTKDDYLIWTQNKIEFDSTRISDVANILKEHYGVEVNLEGKDIEKEMISGIMPNDNLDVLISSMEATQDYVITRNGNTITIRSKN
jgi:ferric-dicitrate binding protein FerR (iron transport regulator)